MALVATHDEALIDLADSVLRREDGRVLQAARPRHRNAIPAAMSTAARPEQRIQRGQVPGLRRQRRPEHQHIVRYRREPAADRQRHHRVDHGEPGQPAAALYPGQSPDRTRRSAEPGVPSPTARAARWRPATAAPGSAAEARRPAQRGRPRSPGTRGGARYGRLARTRRRRVGRPPPAPPPSTSPGSKRTGARARSRTCTSWWAGENKGCASAAHSQPRSRRAAR